MRLLKQLIILIAISLSTISISYADNTTHSNAPVVFQVVQDQISFDHSLIKSASLITKKDGSFGGLQIVIKPSASKELTRVTEANVGKIANLVINDKIVASATLRSSLKNQFLITEITKTDAQKFIDSLHG